MCEQLSQLAEIILIVSGIMTGSFLTAFITIMLSFKNPKPKDIKYIPIKNPELRRKLN